MDSQDVWIPYIVTHCFTFALIFICYKWPKIGKVAWGIIFILAGTFNMYTGNSNPQAQILVGIFLLMKRTLFLLGIVGGIIFLLAISPLGIGSAFPSTLLMSISLVLLYLRYKKA